MDGIDPYDWQDDVDLWPAITQLQVCMYLILAPSPYSEKDFINYKSLDCYIPEFCSRLGEASARETRS